MTARWTGSCKGSSASRRSPVRSAASELQETSASTPITATQIASAAATAEPPSCNARRTSVIFGPGRARRIGERGWPPGAKVRVRIGVHTGRPTLTDEGYVGLAVHTVARICESGHGGQIVVSQRVRDVLREAMPEGISLRSLGAHKLRGLAGSQRIYEVRAKGLPTGFPPPRVRR